VSERPRAIEAESPFRSLFHRVPVPLYRTTPDGQILAVNPAFAALLGYPDEADLLSISATDLYTDPADRRRYAEMLERIGRVEGFETRLRRADGESIWVQDSALAVMDENGAVRYYEGSITDTSQKREAEESLRRSEQRYRAVSDLTSDYAYSVRLLDDGSMELEWITDAFERATGHSLAEANAHGLLSFVHPDDLPAVEAGMTKLVRGQDSTLEMRIITKPGQVRWFNSHARPRLDPETRRLVGFVGAARDITDAKRAELALQESEGRYRELFASSPNPMWIYDIETLEYLAVNDAAVEQYGYTRNEFLAMTIKDIRPPEDVPRLLENVEATREDLARSRDWRHLTRDGQILDVEITSHGLDWDGRPARLVVVTDVTERLRAEAALRESERRFRALATTAPVGIFEVDLRGACSFLNEQGAEIFDKPAAECRGFGWMEHVHPEDLERLQERWVEGRERGEEIVHELRIVGVDGRVRWIEGAGRPLVDAWGEIRGYIGTLTDVTERRHGEQDRRRLLADLVQAQEDERRRIATEIHDDPVQAMTAVGMRLESLRRRLSGPGEAEALDEVAGTVRETVARLRRLLFELRPPGLDRERLAAALKTQLERLRDETGVRFELDDQMLQEQPLESRTVLYRIAQEALANVRKHSEATTIHVTLADREEGALLRIRDDGIGFDLDTVDEERSGHLGLVSMRERAEMAGGWFRVAGSEGRGTIVEAWVPAEEPG
jgi:PAS domain S-box-containing protein